ncbi:MAG: hypothetical protein ABEK50_08930 [bacterium]
MVYVLVLTLLVPLILESWTFYNMFRRKITGGTQKKSQLKSSLKPHYAGRGDEILPETVAREVIRDIYVERRNDRWGFSLRLYVMNPSDRSYEIKITEVILQDGSSVKTGVSKKIGPEQDSTVEIDVALPTRTIPRTLLIGTNLIDRKQTRKHKTNQTQNEVHLSSVPVRKK